MGLPNGGHTNARARRARFPLDVIDGPAYVDLEVTQRMNVAGHGWVIAFLQRQRSEIDCRRVVYVVSSGRGYLDLTLGLHGTGERRAPVKVINAVVSLPDEDGLTVVNARVTVAKEQDDGGAIEARVATW